jgi:hypothetical protein
MKKLAEAVLKRHERKKISDNRALAYSYLENKPLPKLPTENPLINIADKLINFDPTDPDQIADFLHMFNKNDGSIQSRINKNAINKLLGD